MHSYGSYAILAQLGRGMPRASASSRDLSYIHSVHGSMAEGQVVGRLWHSSLPVTVSLEVNGLTAYSLFRGDTYTSLNAG
jgi:hypothetical protein